MNDLILLSIPEQSVIYGMSFDDYRALDAINASGLKLIERSPLHYVTAVAEPHAPTASQALGTLAHLLILEPERESDAIVAPECDRRTKEGKALWADFQAQSAGKLIVTQDQFDAARAMRDSVLANDSAAALLSDGKPEVTLSYHDEGTRIKCRLDWLCSGHAVICDLKTANDASEKEFGRAAGKYAYHMQAALYTDAAQACGLGARDFVFIVVENTAPFATALYLLEPDAIQIGRMRYQRALEKFRECAVTQDWHGYAQEIQPLSIPHWAL